MNQGKCGRCKRKALLYPLHRDTGTVWICLECRRYLMKLNQFLKRLEKLSLRGKYQG